MQIRRPLVVLALSLGACTVDTKLAPAGCEANQAVVVNANGQLSCVPMVSGQCDAGLYVAGVDSRTGRVVCAPDRDTQYGAGPGLTATDGGLGVAFAGSGSANSVARSDHAHAQYPERSEVQSMINSAQPWTPASGGIAYSGGNVGVGTAEPVTRLHVNQETAQAPAAMVEGESHGAVGLRHRQNDGGTWWLVAHDGRYAVRGPQATLTAAEDRLVVKANGSVGIGNSDPQARLHVEENSTSASSVAHFHQRGDSGHGVLITGGSVRSDSYSLRSRNSALEDCLYVSNQCRIGIGNAGPTASLDVAGSSIRIRSPETQGATAPCEQGKITWDASYLYVCIQANVWKRVALSSF